MSLAVDQNDARAFSALVETGVAVVVGVVVELFVVVAEVEIGVLGWSQQQPNGIALCSYFSYDAQH